ncbi:MAG TPA: ABC transporter substrate-binding protein [Acidimicrobiales bacterium]|nr:ABC transporter substrate-binding protein [Acidimicrobiales bacterium]
MQRTKTLVTIFGSMAMAALLLAACSSSPSSSAPGATGATGATKGGVLKLVGQGDVDFMDTADGYYDVTYTLDRAIARQLYTWPTGTTLASELNPVPDLATSMPTITNGGKTYTITIRTGAMWDTKPARQITAQDEVTGMKRLCNPASPTGAPGYFENTIVGMQSYCTAFAKVGTDVTSIDSFMNTHDIAGVKATGPETIQFNLTQPASDFIDILSLPFSSPVPKEELAYVPASPQLAQHFVSDGPYTIKSYVPNTSIDLVRDPAWNPSTDSVRKAYVNEMQVTEGVAENTTALQQIQAGTEDVFWDQNVPTAALAGMVADNDPNLVLGPDGNNYITINPYISINLQSPNNGGALSKLPVRQALEYAINKYADSQVYGGSAVSGVLDQMIPSGSVGYVSGYDPYPSPNGQGDPTKAKQLLASAGYSPGQITLKLIYRTNTVHPQIAQTDQAALQAAGFNVQLIPVTPANTIYTSYLENPTASKNGSWDIAEPGWIPDWLGNNGRSVIEPLFDGRTYGPNTQDYGDYNSTTVNSDIDHALAATTTAQATSYWQAAAKQIMADAAVVPVGAQKVAEYHSSRVHNCEFWWPGENCDITNVWLSS